MENMQESYTRHYIVQAMFILMNEYEYDKINITDIARKAGVGRATFYRYFKSKEDVVLYYFNTSMRNFQFNQRLYPRCKDDYIKIATEVFTLFKENKDYFKLLYRAHLDYIYLGFLNDNFSRVFGEEYPESSAYAPYLYSGMLYNVSTAWLQNDCRECPSDLARTIVDAIYFN